MAQELKADICVIGTGAGGVAAASAAAAFGVPVVLVRNTTKGDGGFTGGTLPAKALIAAAGHAAIAHHGAPLGGKAMGAGIDFAAVRGHVRAAVAAAAARDTPERFAGLGMRVLDGAARFIDPRTVAAGDVTIKARRFIIATGSAPVVPAIPGLAEIPHVTDETVFDLAACPRHLVVIGAGTVGLELGQAFRRLGAEVTVLEAAAPLAGSDAECAAVVLEAIAREGIRLRTGVKIVQVRPVLARVQVMIETPAGAETIEGSHLLVAAGHRPNVEGLDLDAAGIRYAPHGIAVDRRQRTTNTRVYAIGEVTGGPRLAHLAEHQAGLAIRDALFRVPVRLNHQAVPSVICTDPELAQVGFLEDEARAHAGAIRLLRWRYSDNDRAQATGATMGHIKIITDRRGGILGATIVGAQAGENIAAWALAINQRLNIRAFANLMVPYPTYAEVGKRAAMSYFMRGLTTARVRRIMAWLRRLG